MVIGEMVSVVVFGIHNPTKHEWPRIGPPKLLLVVIAFGPASWG